MEQILLVQATGDSMTACWTHEQQQPAVEYAAASSIQASDKRTDASAIPDESTTVCIDELLTQHDPFIRALAKKHVYDSYAWIRPELLEEKITDLAQRSRTKFWQALRQNMIKKPKAYIRCIVCTEAVDMVRQRLRAVPLSLTEDGELYNGRLLVERSEGMNDPALEAEQHETLDYYMSFIVAAVTNLPPRQQKAMLCYLKDQLGDSNLLAETCKKWNIDIDAIAWPEEVDEQHRLKACVAPAKKKILALVRRERQGLKV